MNKSMKKILVFVLLCCSINTQIIRQIGQSSPANQVNPFDFAHQAIKADVVNQADVNIRPPRTPCFDYTICGNYCWSQWYDIDDPSGNGDFELLKDIRKQFTLPCPDTQVLLECQTTTGIPFYQTGDTVGFNQVDGCWCYNKYNVNGGCKYDYRLRILCPC